MNHNGHLKQMLLGGGVLLVGMLLFGVPLATALPYAALLACPLMMVWMMFAMSGSQRRDGSDLVHGSADSHRDSHRKAPEAERASTLRSR